MDRWKRNSDGVLVNDDATGYANARKRNAIRIKKKDELEEARERIAILESKVKDMEKTIVEIVGICRNLLKTF